MYNCPICNSETRFIINQKIKNTINREFYLCEECIFIFVPSEFHITPELELERYEKHTWKEINKKDFNNYTLDEYNNTLNDLILYLILGFDLSIKYKSYNSFIHLDYGCGKYPNLSNLLKWNFEKLNISVSSNNYDKYFNNNLDYLGKDNYGAYGLITSIEVVEHFREPLKEFELLSKLLSNQSSLVIMTEFIPQNIIENIDNKEIFNDYFKDWWYKNDETHVCFYSTKTFEVLAKKFSFGITFNNESKVIVLSK